MTGILPIRSATRTACRFYARGSCTKGTHCPYLHAEWQTTAPISPSSSTTSKTARPCVFFALGTCNKGARCTYSHEADLEAAPPTVQDQSEGDCQRDHASGDSRPQVLCSFFARGKCLKGDKCAFSHSEVAAATTTETEVKDNTTMKEDWSRSFGGGLVTFEDGAAVSKVSMPTDFSAVRLDKLPRHTDARSISRLLVENGIMDELASTRIFRPADPNSSHCSAEVKVEDPSFARRLCAMISSTENSQIEAVAITSRAPAVTGHRRIDCGKLTCSWHRPVKLVWLNFGSRDIATKVQTRFASGIYKILDHHVEADVPYGKDDWRNALGWTVALKTVPGRADRIDVARAIPDHWKPRNINLGEATYTADADTAKASVRSLLAEVGPLAWWEDTSGPQSKREKAVARYLEDVDAQKAANLLNNTPLSFAKNVKLSVQALTTAKFRVLTRIYKALEKRVTAHKQAWKDAQLWFNCYAPVNGYNVLKIEGENRKDVADAADTLEGILTGQIATVDGVPLWSPSLRNNDGTYEKVKAIQAEMGTVIIRNRRKCVLTLYGPADKFEQTRDSLATVLRESSASTFSIAINVKQLQWARAGGLRSISRAIGGSRATFDDPFNPKAVLVSGSNEQRRLAKELIDAQGPSATYNGDEDVDCSVCWMPAEDPVSTHCGHVYCGDCFENLCESAFTSNEARASVICKGNADQCRTTFSLEELEENLSMGAMEDLLESSFKSYVTKNPLKFRYCPAPNCSAIYRVGTGRMQTCPRCALVTCTSCHYAGGHAGVSCAEFRARGAGTSEADKQLMKSLGIKECPRCKTAIEKTEGCNHMTCGGCRIHICWKCMETFATAGSCYDHLSRKHGGAFDVDHEWN